MMKKIGFLLMTILYLVFPAIAQIINVPADQGYTLLEISTGLVFDCNGTPVGMEDVYAVEEGNTLVVPAPGPLANDVDPEGDAIIMSSVSAPSHGSITSAVTSGSFSYVPDDGFTGTDQFEYTIRDAENNLYEPVTVTIQVVEPFNRKPIGISDEYAIPTGTSLDVEAPGPLANDIDPDGDAISMSSISVVPSHGTITAAVTNGHFTYVPDDGFTGTDQFEYTIRDAENNFSEPVTVIIHVVEPFNRIPLGVIDHYGTLEATPLDVEAPGPLANDIDPDGDAISMSSLSAPSHGTITAAITNGHFTYVPDDGFTGTDQFEYTIRDAENNFSEPVTVIIEVIGTNQPPVASAMDITTECSGLSGTIVLLDGSATTDPEADMLQYTWYENGSVIAGPSSSPTAEAQLTTGVHLITLTVEDMCGNTSSDIATVTIEDNTPPEAPAPPPDLILQCASEVPSPVDLTAIDNCDGEIKVSPSQVFTSGDCVNDFTLVRTWTFTDECGNSSSINHTITVNDNTPPVIQEISEVIRENKSGLCGAYVDYPPDITATDNCLGEVILSYDIPSGSFFPVGSTIVTVTATDDCGNLSTAPMVITVNDTEPPYMIPPNSMSQPNDPGLCGAVVTLVQPIVTDNCGDVSINSDAPPEFPIGQTVVTWTAIDIHGNQSTASSIVEVTDLPVPPNEPVISAPVDPVPINTIIDFSAISTDNNIQSAIWDWGHNGETSGASVVYSNTGTEFFGQHSYGEAGVYTITLTVTECDGATASSIYQYVVVYDPSGGFVTGGGWIDSPSGAYTSDPSLEGKANFGFVSKYKKGANVPTGNTEFQFKAGDLNFNSYLYDWLVIAESKAKFKGEGTINGTGEFGFMLSAIDGDLKSNGGEDMFRIKIWDKLDGDVVVYDNQIMADDNADPTTSIAGGSIVIHTKDNKKSASVIESTAKINIYPNPFDNSIYLDLFSESSHNIIIDMIDINGRVVEYFFTGVITAEVDHHFEFNTKADLKPGSYMFRIRTENGELLEREIIIKR